MHQRKVFSLEDCHTMAQAADVFTKPITSFITWSRSMLMIGMHYDLEECSKHPVCVWKAAAATSTSTVPVMPPLPRFKSAPAPQRSLPRTPSCPSGSVQAARSSREERLVVTPARKRSRLAVTPARAMALIWDCDSVVSKGSAASVQLGVLLGACGGDP